MNVPAALCSLLLVAGLAEAGELAGVTRERGSVLAMLAMDVPAGSVADGERATVEIEFTVDLRGRVVDARLRSASAAALGESLLQQQRQWLYAVATRTDDCHSVRAFRGLQRIAVERSGGKLRTELGSAEVIELLDGARVETLADAAVNVREVLRRVPYPPAALRANVETSFALPIDFDAEGKVTGTYPLGVASDERGFVRAAVGALRHLRANPDVTQGRPMTMCTSIQFRVR